MKVSKHSNNFILVLPLLLSFVSGEARSALDGPIESKLEQPFSQNQKLFGTLRIKHFTDTHYDGEGYLLKQNPSLETIAKIGLRYYRGRFELFGEAGVIKVPGTQKVIQKRPIIGAYYYPAFGRWGEVLVYNINELPFSEADSDGLAANPQSQGSISTLGIAPQAHIEGSLGGWPIGMRFGIDLWSKVYSRRQLVDREEQTDINDLALAATMAEETLEDGDPSLWQEAKLGFYIFPGGGGSFASELMAFVDNQHYPFYYSDDDGNVDKKYKAHRRSRLRLRSTLKLTGQLYLRNDLVKEYHGLFSSRARSPKESLRNVFQLGFRF